MRIFFLVKNRSATGVWSCPASVIDSKALRSTTGFFMLVRSTELNSGQVLLNMLEILDFFSSVGGLRFISRAGRAGTMINLFFQNKLLRLILQLTTYPVIAKHILYMV